MATAASEHIISGREPLLCKQPDYEHVISGRGPLLWTEPECEHVISGTGPLLRYKQGCTCSDVMGDCEWSEVNPKHELPNYVDKLVCDGSETCFERKCFCMTATASCSSCSTITKGQTLSLVALAGVRWRRWRFCSGLCGGGGGGTVICIMSPMRSCRCGWSRQGRAIDCELFQVPPEGPLPPEPLPPEGPLPHLGLRSKSEAG
jgi:hypothetical protein